MEPVSRLRATVERYEEYYDDVTVAFALTLGDLRAILVRLDNAELTAVPWCWEHACDAALCHPRHVIDDGRPLPAPFDH